MIVHNHNPAKHSGNNFFESKIYFKATKFVIPLHRPPLWNSLTDTDTKTITLPHFVKEVIRTFIDTRNRVLS